MSRHAAWRLAGGASALLALSVACARAPTDATVRTIPRDAGVDVACAPWAMPTYALVGGAWRAGARVETRTLYMEAGVLRERPPARVDDTLDLRGLELAGAGDARVRDGDAATFVALRAGSPAVALRVSQGCVTW